MDRQVKNSGKTIWIVLTCVLTIAVFVLAAGLYHFRQLTLTLESQLAETEEKNTNLSAEVIRHREEIAAAENEIRTVRVMNGILQQQDGNDEWIDVAPVEELESEDPILLGRNKMQELIDKNREAVQNGTAKASEISPLIEGKRTESEDTLVSFSSVQSVTEKTTTRTSKPGNSNTSSAATTPKTTAPTATEPSATQPSASGDGSSGGSSDSGSSYTAPSDSGSSGGSSTDSGSSSGGSSDSGSSDSGSSDSGSGGSSDSDSSDSGSSDSGSSESGDGEDIGWTDDIL